jgi:hypothetical protein
VKCADCPREFDPPYKTKNAKYCRPCQVLRTVLYHGDRVKECWICDTKFAPLMNGQTVCPKCRPMKTRHSAPGTCSFCNRDRDDLLGADVKVCPECAATPGNRKTLAKSLVRKQQEARE